MARPKTRTVLLSCLLAAAGVLAPGSASAAPNFTVYPGADSCMTPHCYERAIDNHANLAAARVNIQSTWFSLEDQTRPGYVMPAVATGCGGPGLSCGWAITHELWFSSADQTRWVEVGLRNGYEPPAETFPNGAPGCGCLAYYRFWEDGAPGNSDTYSHTHLIANVSPDNAWHTYGVTRRSPGVFDVTVDGAVVGTSTNTRYDQRWQHPDRQREHRVHHYAADSAHEPEL